MRITSFQYPYEKVFKRSKSILRKQHYDVLSEDYETGIISARKKSGLFRPPINLEINIIKIDERSTSAKVNAKIPERWMFDSVLKVQKVEGAFIGMLSSHI